MEAIKEETTMELKEPNQEGITGCPSTQQEGITGCPRKEKNRIRQSKYRLDNPDKIKAQQKAYRERTSMKTMSNLYIEIEILTYENNHLRKMLEHLTTTI